MPLIYSPMLKTKSGEITALNELQPSTKDRLYPVLHITQTLTQKYPQQFAAAWSNRPIAVDGNFSFNENGSISDFNNLLSELRNLNVDARPSISISSDPTLIAAGIAQTNSSGLVLKVTLNEVGQAVSFCSAHQISPNDTDLILDMGHLAGMPIALLAPMVANELNKAIGTQTPFRRITLAAAAAPKDFGELPRGRSVVPRLDWQLWQAVSALVSCDLHYGDYCTGHPDLTEPPGVAMARATVSARYSDGSNWIAVKGFPTTGQNGQPMNSQYLGHARILAQEANFANPPGCWGDQQIADIVSTIRKPGNRKTWTEIAVNRHIEVVAAQLP